MSHDVAYNQLSPAEAERLAILSEELGEAIQAIGKILRHGYAESHPAKTHDNRTDLERELGDVRFAALQMCEAGDINKDRVRDYTEDKRIRVAKYLHHQS